MCCTICYIRSSNVWPLVPSRSVNFLKGLGWLHHHVKDPIPSWDLNLVLAKRMDPPFELLAACSLLRISMKVAFLVAIILARRVSEFTCSSVWTFIYSLLQGEGISTASYKVVSHYHISQAIYLSIFFLKPLAHKDEERLHILGVKRALVYYLSRTKLFRSSSQLFVQTG